MSTHVVAIYEKGSLRLLTPVSLPEQTRVRLEILSEEAPTDDVQRAEAALIAAGVIRSRPQPVARTISPARRAELARLYATGGPLSATVIADRDPR